MKKTYFFITALLMLNLFVSSCKKDDKTVDCTTFQWGYTGDAANWNNCYADCGEASQSPVNITAATTNAGLTPLETHYEDAPVDIYYNGHTEEFEYEEGSTLKLNGKDYQLLQFHFHTESEHTVNGTHYPMEVHLVHKDTTSGQLAVIGIFFEEGAENPFLQHFIDHLPTVKDQHYKVADFVNVSDLLPADKGYYTYSGSLTTPPCSEIVTWFVMKSPVTASAAQIDKMHAIIHDNNRAIQALNTRTISKSF